MWAASKRGGQVWPGNTLGGVEQAQTGPYNASHREHKDACAAASLHTYPPKQRLTYVKVKKGGGKRNTITKEQLHRRSGDTHATHLTVDQTRPQ